MAPRKGSHAISPVVLPHVSVSGLRSTEVPVLLKRSWKSSLKIHLKQVVKGKLDMYLFSFGPHSLTTYKNKLI